ncbi:MAG: aminoacyl-histidine dipeptidase [Calditrichaeota bacterium]|nr:aminoacyl-histidine dipeptidase [Calditrichota bacterium]
MKDAIAGLNPELLWKHFYEMSQIPRCSKHEEKIRQYVIDFAERKGFKYRMDETLNVVVEKPATPGRENAPIVVLQGHLDMVCEKNKDVQHDFSKDPIKLLRKGDWMTADGTTLGADNGIGVAAALAVLDGDDVQHGPLECLFTMDEETGLTGAINLSDKILHGKILINMDSEEDGAFYIGCAGGRDTEIFLPLETEPVPAGYTVQRLRLGGLQGGHSGLMIHTGLGNGIKLLGRFLGDVAKDLGLRLMHIDGGSKHNAIPRECDAIVALPSGNLGALKDKAAAYQKIYHGELHLADPGVFLRVDGDGFENDGKMFTEKLHNQTINAIIAMPHGVMAMSLAVPGLVETSNNMAVIKTDHKRVSVLTSQRSSVQSALEGITQNVAAVGQLASGDIEFHNGYPAWQPNPESKLLKVAESVWEEQFGNKPEVKAIHAGLECGIIGDKFPGMDMLSFGPTIEGAHSPDEKVQISTVERFWKFLKALLEHL